MHQHGGDRAAAAVELRFDDGAFRRTVRIGLQVENFRLQADGFEQPVDIELLGRGYLDVEDLAAERLDLDFVLQQFSAHPFRLCVGPIDFVDRHDHRHFRSLGVVDRFHGLRHDAVVGGDHEHDDVGHLGAACAHRGKGGVARGVDEGDLAAGGRGHLVGADMLGDAAGFARRHLGGANGVEQRRLAVIDVAHDRHDRGTRHQRTRIVGDVEESLFHVGLRHAFDGVAQFLGQQLGGIGVDHVVDLRHMALFHQQLDHIHPALGHAVGELLDGDGFGNGNLAHELFLRLVGGVPLQPLYAAAECCDRSLTLFVGTERRHQCEPSATFLRTATRRFRRRCRSRRSARTAANARSLFLVGLERRPRGGGGPCGRRGVLAETLLRLLLGLELGFELVLATLLLIGLTGLGGVALAPLHALARLPDQRLFLGNLALLGLAQPGIAQRARTGRALFFGEGSQHDP